MSDFEKLAASVYRPLSATMTGTRFVADAFALNLPAAERFEESAVKLQQVEFASFAVGGLAAGAQAPEAGQVRASSLVELPLADSAGGQATASQRVTLFGPGDVRGLDAPQIVRRHPAPGTQSAEETVLAHVEFDRPELPWQFSAATRDLRGRLRPWLALVVVEKSAARWEPAVALLPVLAVPRSELPDLDDAALWAHAQAPQAAQGVSLEARLSPEYAELNLSRLLSPRVLQQNTDYIAAVVPVVDIGVKAGLGLAGGSLERAWGDEPGDTPVRLPVYDHWAFRTGPDGDFRSLALRLDGVVAPWEVGRRFVDVSQPGAPLGPLPADSPGRRLVLKCALFSPVTPAPTPELQAVEQAQWPAAAAAGLQQQLNLPAQLEGDRPDTDGVDDLPIVGPRLYGAAHRGCNRVDVDPGAGPGTAGSDWFAQLNLSPLHRIVAGLGTRVVQRDQEQLMQAAWAQLGEVEKANAAIRQAQLAELLARRLHARMAQLRPGRLLQVAGPAASRLMPVAGRTLAATVAGSATAGAVLGGAFRRALRPGGPMLRRAAAAARTRMAELLDDAGRVRDFTRQVREPDGVGALPDRSIRLLDATRAARALGVGEDELVRTLGVASRNMAGGLAAHLSRPERWRDPAPRSDWATAIATDWSDRLQRVPEDPVLAAIREQRVAPLAAELALSPTIAAQPVRERLVSQAVQLNNGLVARLQAARGAATAGGGGGGSGTLPPSRPRPGAAGGLGGVMLEPVRLPGRPAVGGLGLPRGGAPVRVFRPLAGRVESPVPGVSAIDVSHLVAIPAGSADTQLAALSATARLAVRPVAPVLERAASLPMGLLRASLGTLLDPAGVLAMPEVPRRAPASAQGLLEALDPARTVRAALRGRLQLSDAVRARWQIGEALQPIMAAPRFDRPMYEALNDLDRDWLIPGLGLLPRDDFVTVLATNAEFVESFLVGLSDEMGRELLWRGYPTDRRGTCFWRFWDRDQDELKQPVHRFGRTPLASHVAIGGDGGTGPRAAIVIKSELVRRFPDLIVDVLRNQGSDAHPVFETPQSPQQSARQLFVAHLEPDIVIVGVDLSIDELQHKAWWIVVAEHPSAIRFERPDDATVGGQRFLRGGGAAHGAEFAHRRLHDPTRVAFQARDLIRSP